MINKLSGSVKNPRPAISGKITFATIGVLLIAIGSYLPWFQNNPNYIGPPNILLLTDLRTTGIERINLLLLIPAVLILALIYIRGLTSEWAISALITGIVAVLLPMFFAIQQYVNYDMYLLPDVGWVVTMIGGLILTILGGYIRFLDT